MEVIMGADYDEMSQKAFEQVDRLLHQKNDAILGLATGSTPIGLYRRLVRAYREGKLDFSQVQSFNLDEYLGIDEKNPQSYHSFMQEQLFQGINIRPSAIHFPHLVEEGELDYDEQLRRVGYVDLQILGIGRNGHIAFNEPAEALNVKTSQVQLTPSTIEANSRFFDRKEDVPTRAISMGLGSIMKAKKILLLASGADKAEAVSRLLDGEQITTKCPATMLLMHPNCLLIVDRAAAGRLS